MNGVNSRRQAMKVEFDSDRLVTLRRQDSGAYAVPLRILHLDDSFRGARKGESNKSDRQGEREYGGSPHAQL
jgi:hypothetical protein